MRILLNRIRKSTFPIFIGLGVFILFHPSGQLQVTVETQSTQDMKVWLASTLR